MKLLLLSILILITTSMAEDNVESFPMEENQARVKKVKNYDSLEKRSLERLKMRDEALEKMRRKETSSPNTFLKRKKIKIPMH